MARRIGALDGLRGLAVAMVVLTHTLTLAPQMPYAWIASRGHLGVDMFFVLSGFLITSLLLNEFGTEGGVRFRGFYAFSYRFIERPFRRTVRTHGFGVRRRHSDSRHDDVCVRVASQER